MSAITAAEVLIKYSVAAAAGNTTAGTAAGSLGDQISTTQVAAGANGIFDDVSGPENAASEDEYRCVLIHNSNASNPMEACTVYLSAEVALGASIALAVDPTAASAIGSGSAQALTIANEDTAPAGPLTFSSPTTAGAGIAIGDIPAGFCKAIWIRRRTANTAALSNDGFTLGVYFETGSL